MMIGICTSVACTLMVVVYFWARAIRNAGIVDVVWAFGFILLAAICALSDEGWWIRRLLLFGMVAVWSSRLGIHLTKRFLKLFPAEDSRYKELREQAGVNAEKVIFAVFLWQGLIMALLMAPYIMASANQRGAIMPGEWAGVAIWLVGLCGEAMADSQLASFSSNPTHKGQICQIGLWQFSRHPNYFFEWLVWVGFFVFALSSPDGWLTAYAPLMMLHLLVNVTGVKLSEAHSLKTRGADYVRYQKSTSMFVPWFKRQTQ